MPLLGHRKKVGKMTQKAFESGVKLGTGEKKDFLHELNCLIKQRLFKIRLSSMPFAGPVDIDAATNLFRQIMKEANKSKEKEQLSCCSSCLIFLLRMMPSSPEFISLASTEYGNVVDDWSKKRSIRGSLLDDLISNMPAFAQASLLASLNRATYEGRTTFLKVDAFRLLSLLLANKPNTGASEIDKVAHAKIHESQDNLLTTINNALKDEEMVKPKRVRTIIKALEKILPCMSSPASQEALDLLENIKAKINELGEKHVGLNNYSAKIVEQIETRLEELKVVHETPAKHVKTHNASASTSKKSKKKKKKRKR